MYLSMEAPPLEMLGGFLIHNIPSIAMIALLICLETPGGGIRGLPGRWRSFRHPLRA